MKELVFSQSAVYQLQQLAKAVREKTGVRHRLSDNKSITSLLRYGSTSPDADIFSYFSRFSNELDADQRNYLSSRGLILPMVTIDKMLSEQEHRRAV